MLVVGRAIDLILRTRRGISRLLRRRSTDMRGNQRLSPANSLEKIWISFLIIWITQLPITHPLAPRNVDKFLTTVILPPTRTNWQRTGSSYRLLLLHPHPRKHKE